MARIKGKDTLPERQVAALLSPHGLSWESHAADLPGRPDLVFRDAKVVVFVDGDFWHGWRFPQWRDKLSVEWEAKIKRNRERDVRNQRKLRRMGWKVVRLWEHQICDNPDSAKRRVLVALGLEPLMELLT
ncbi:very short patch repair endonuclease [Mesoterricola silvestris]|uniref:Very short patch repair endonuclease n=2 Tax=Mesoterricola silvestris TaxID=2927979 RepID=A0AA48K773_9BACT|nr:very short patch repair endonuclease [Mesoterricola silvestris]